jgi:uncharacterized protein (TIGR02466 family)
MTADSDNATNSIQRTAHPSEPERLAQSALENMMTGELQIANREFRRALQLAPDAVDILANFGALLHYRGHQATAINNYRRVLALEPNEIGVRCNLAKALADCGRFDDALTEANAAIDRADGLQGSLATRGAVLVDAERYAEAAESLTRSLELEPGNDMALVNLALCQLQLDNLPASTTCLMQAVELNPHNARAVSDLINCLSAADNNGDALSLAEGFLTEHPAERLVIGSYAQALLNAGRDDDAIALTDSDLLVQVFDLPAPDGFDDQAAFHTQLVGELRDDPSLLCNPTGKATRGGEQTGELDLDSSPAMQAFATMANEAVAQAAHSYQERGLENHPVMLPAAKQWQLRTWGTIIHAGGGQSPHLHPLGWLSAVYYAALPKDMPAEGKCAGWLEFGQPPERFHCRINPTVTPVEPRQGRLVIFPSWFWHRTLPFASPDPRISIAFDVLPSNGQISF